MQEPYKPVPRPIEELHQDMHKFLKAVDCLIEYLDGPPEEIHDDGYCDREEWIVQSAIDWVYGPEVWGWVNQKRR